MPCCSPSAAIPAYLLARRLVSPGWALVVALLCVSVPWTVNAAFVMSEAAAYPVFLWAVLACHVCIAEPSRRSDALAVVALALAFFTRPQFLFLAAVLPLAALITVGPRPAFRQHRLLATVYGVGALLVVVLAALGQAHRLLGDYGVTATQGSLLPAIAWKSAAIHVDVLAVGLGVVPLLLGGGWAYSALREGSDRLRGIRRDHGARRLAARARDRLVRRPLRRPGRDPRPVSLLPRSLLLLATVVCLLQERLPLVGIAGVTAVFAATAVFADFAPVAGLWVDSPESVLNDLIHDQSGGLPAGVFVALCGVVLGVICLGLALVPRRPALLGVVVAVFCFGGAVAGYAFDRLLTTNTPLGVPTTGKSRVRDWIDSVVPAGNPVGVLAYPLARDWGQSAIQWWDAEFWNNRARAGLRRPRRGRTPTRRSRALSSVSTSPPDGSPGPKDARHSCSWLRTTRGSGSPAHRPRQTSGSCCAQVERPYRAQWATPRPHRDAGPVPGGRPRSGVYAATGRGHAAVTVYGAARRAAGGGRRRSPSARRAERNRPAGHAGPAGADGVHPTRRARRSRALRRRSAAIEGPPLAPTPGPVRNVGVAVSGVVVTDERRPC